MNIVANNVASKLFVAFVAVAMLFTLVTPAKAATTEELQQMINDLLAQIASLQGQVGQGGSAVTAAGVCPYTWTRSLTTGATGADVMKLQQFLNADADTRVSASGVGSAGMETEYFGPATAAAVSKFQTKYRSDVLSPAGLVNPTGYFGPATMSKANMLCASAPVVVPPTTGGDTTGGDTTTGGSSADLSGEASLKSFTANSGDDTDLEEGQKDAPVADFKVKFTDGDARITRVDLALTGSGAEARPYKAFTKVSLWVDGDKVAEKSVDTTSAYLSKTDGTLRFAGLDIVGMEDEEVTITVAVSVMGSVDGAGVDSDWEVAMNSLRFVDATDVTSTLDSGDDADFGSGVAFTVGAEGGDDELIAKTSSENPAATTLELKDDGKSDWTTVFVWKLDTDQSVNDITVNNLLSTVHLSSSTYNAIVADARLIVDGVTFDTVDVTGGTSKDAVLDFDTDGDVVIDAGDTATAELQLRFATLIPQNEGMTITASTSADDYDAEGADTLDATQLQGTVTGKTHTLRTMGIIGEPGTFSAAVTTGQNDLDDYGTYSIKVDITAFNQDVYIDVDPSTSVVYDMEDGTGASIGTASTSVTLSSTADEDDGGYYVVNEGDTETFTVEVTYTPGIANTVARLQLVSFDYADSAAAPTDTWTAEPAKDYQTALKTIVN